MKRDWDLLKKILQDVEEAPSGTLLGQDQFVVEDKVGLFEHVKLLCDARLIEAKLLPAGPGGGEDLFVIKRLTMEGHDLLDKMRSEQLWSRIKSIAKDKGLSLSFEVVKVLGTEALKQLVK